MRRLRVKVQVFKEKRRGEIAVFLSLVFILIMSLVTALIESASIRLVKNSRRTSLSLALESVFAEYDKELFDNYHIFGIDTEDVSVLDRIAFYGGDMTDNEIAKSQLLTDQSGQAFYQMAVAYETARIGLSSILPETDLEFWEENEQQNEQYQEEQDSVLGEITGKLEEAGESLPEEDNPIAFLGEWKEQGILSLLLGSEIEISDKAMELEHLPSHRELQTGVGSFGTTQGISGISAKALFGNYALHHFSDFAHPEETRKISYETEYLLGAKKSDRENLEYVLNKILLIRFPINYVYLLQDETKKMEAEAMAASLCTLLTVPGITTLVKHAILLAWAYGESVMDLRILAKGEKVPTVKTSETWNLGLSNLANLGNSADSGSGSENGMKYEEYVRILLLLESEKNLCMRALDLIEHELGIQADSLVTRLEVHATGDIRRGVKCEFQIAHGYQ